MEAIPANTPRSWILISVAIGVAIGVVVSGEALSGRPIPAWSPSQPSSPFSSVVRPAGGTWVLTPPVSWCTATPLGSGGIQETCSGDYGTGGIELNVTEPARLSGTMNVSGPATLWLYPAVDGCEWFGTVSPYHPSCAPAANPPGWNWWSERLVAGSVNLSALPLNITSRPGELPPPYWVLAFVDSMSTNETLSALTPISLHSL